MLFSAKKKNLKCRGHLSATRRSLRMESLEERRMLTVHMFDFADAVAYEDSHGIDFDETSGVLSITGSSLDDSVVVSYDNNGTLLALDDAVDVSMHHAGHEHLERIAVYGLGTLTRQLKQIVFRGRAGHDVFRNNTGIVSIAYGGSGEDRLYGGSNRDYLSGGADNDRLEGRDGDDILVGAGGNDKLFGGDGHDNIWAGAGDDLVMGGEGNDNISAGEGHDFVFGGNGDDNIWAGKGDDLVFGGDGNDAIAAGDGFDFVWGGEGGDILWGGRGNDRLEGGSGDDSLVGNNGADLLLGGAGDDEIWGGQGLDVLEGGLGQDCLKGGTDRDYLWGGLGNDSLYGETGSDRLYGGPGIDHLEGGSNKDRLYGGDDNDHLFGGNGVDTLFGGEGDDFLAGAYTDSGWDWNTDYLYGGGPGADTYLQGDWMIPHEWSLDKLPNIGGPYDTVIKDWGFWDGYTFDNPTPWLGSHCDEPPPEAPPEPRVPLLLYGVVIETSAEGDGELYGPDNLYEGPGKGRLEGGSSQDRLHRGDLLFGEEGNDYLTGAYTDGGWDENTDYLSGGPGADPFLQGDWVFPKVWSLDRIKENILDGGDTIIKDWGFWDGIDFDTSGTDFFPWEPPPEAPPEPLVPLLLPSVVIETSAEQAPPTDNTSPAMMYWPYYEFELTSTQEDSFGKHNSDEEAVDQMWAEYARYTHHGRNLRFSHGSTLLRGVVIQTSAEQAPPTDNTSPAMMDGPYEFELTSTQEDSLGKRNSDEKAVDQMWAEYAR